MLRFVTCVLALLCPKAEAATVSSRWRADSGNWTGSTNWIHSPTDPAADFPDNDAVTYDVTITNGHVLLQQSVTIDKLTFADGLLNNEGALTLGDWFNWNGGRLSGTGTLVASYGMTATGGTNESTLRLRGMGHEISSMHQRGTVFVETNYAWFDSCTISGSFIVETNARLWFTSNYFANGSAVRGNGRLDLGYFEGVLSNSCRIDISGPNRGLDGPGRLVLADAAILNMHYGYLRGSGSVEVGPQASISFIGPTPSSWWERTVTNHGTCIFDQVRINGGGPTNLGVLHNFGRVDFFSSVSSLNNVVQLSSVINEGVISFTNDFWTTLRADVTNYGSVEMFFNRFSVSNFVNYGCANLLGYFTATRLENRAGTIVPGYIAAPFTNNAECHVTAFGMSLNGSFHQSGHGVLRVDVDAGVVTNRAAVRIRDEALFDGTLEVALTNGFQPSLGQRLQIMTNNSSTGFFCRIRGLDLGNGLRLAPEVTSNRFDLLVVAASATNDSLTVTRSDTSITLNAPSVLHGYFLQSATNLTTPEWQTIDFVRSNITIPISTNLSERYFRAQNPDCCD